MFYSLFYDLNYSIATLAGSGASDCYRVISQQNRHPTKKDNVIREQLCSLLEQRFSNWGPRTKGGPRRVSTGSARRFRKVVIVCTVFNNLRSICFQICAQVSHSVSVHCVEVLPWFGIIGFLLMSLSSAARDLLTTLIIGSSLLLEMMLWLVYQ